MADVKSVTLDRSSGGVDIPQLGFGVFQVEEGEAQEVVAAALGAGYRHIDTARAYGNEEGVGRAIATSPYPRGDVFVTTKLWNDAHGDVDTVRSALQDSLSSLDLPYVDLYLMHWPVPSADRYVETWRSLLTVRDEGLARAVGVCNFGTDHLQRAYDQVGIMPAINQVELHPYFQQADLRAFHEKHGVVTEAWSPLGQGGDVLEDEVIREIADKHDATPAQVVIAWHLALGNVVIPKSVTQTRIAENFAATDIELDKSDLKKIEKLDRGDKGRIGPDPVEFDKDGVGDDN